MASATMKLEAEVETCCVCGGGGELMTPEEHDAAAPPLQAPLRTMLLHLNNNKVVPEGRYCGNCARRAMEAYEFSSALSSRGAPPLSDKIRALRRRLHELTQKIDVFIVVGPPGGAPAHYREDDIILVEKDAVAAAAAADDDDMEHGRNAAGDTVYQCSVCPLSFQRVSEYRSHCASHPAEARHSCWTCGAQFATRAALADHAPLHAPAHTATCYLCDTTFQSASMLRAHESTCEARCPVDGCGARFAARGELSRHAASAHGRAAPPPHLCPACFRAFPAPDLLSAHMLRHRQAKQFVCGYGDCVLRFATRSNLMSHIRKCHAADLPAEGAAPSDPAPAASAVPCDHCDRTFGSTAAMRRHARVHRATHHLPQHEEEMVTEEVEQYEVEVEGEVEGGVQGEGEAYVVGEGYVVGEESAVEGEGEVEYLEVETLDDAEYMDIKPAL